MTAAPMTLAGFIEELRNTLDEAGQKFSDDGSDFCRHLAIAVRDYSRLHPRTLSASVTLVAGQPNYPAPADLLRPKFSSWGVAQRRAVQPWDPCYLPGPLPKISLVDKDIWLDPAPTAAQIAAFGSCYQYFYYAAHEIGETEAATTIPAADRMVILVRAVSEALAELATRNHNRPVQLGGQMASMPRNGTPAALAEMWREIFERMAA